MKSDILLTLARFFLSCCFICSGVNHVARAASYRSEYSTLVSKFGQNVVGTTLKLTNTHIQWYGHFLFVIGLAVLLRLRVAKWLMVLTIVFQSVLAVPYLMDNQYAELSMVVKNVGLLGMLLGAYGK